MIRRPRRWAVFISGRGSNLQALLDLGSEIELRWVLSSKAKAPGILRAKRAGIPTTVLPAQIDWTALDLELRRRGIDQIFLLGFMKIIPAEFLKSWENRILNVHPSLLPQYPGLHALEKSFEDRASMGATVHIVTPEMDAGPIVLQGKTLKAGFSEIDLAEACLRISKMEHRLVREAALKWA